MLTATGSLRSASGRALQVSQLFVSDLLTPVCLCSDESELKLRRCRLTSFGFRAGMINILHGLGLRFLALGHHTPLMVRQTTSLCLETPSCDIMRCHPVTSSLLFTAHRHGS